MIYHWNKHSELHVSHSLDAEYLLVEISRSALELGYSRLESMTGLGNEFCVTCNSAVE